MNVKTTPKSQIFVVNLTTGETINITHNLYFFEEEGFRFYGDTDLFGNKYEIRLTNVEEIPDDEK